jgi:hypothetical protein
VDRRPTHPPGRGDIVVLAPEERDRIKRLPMSKDVGRLLQHGYPLLPLGGQSWLTRRPIPPDSGRDAFAA